MAKKDDTDDMAVPPPDPWSVLDKIGSALEAIAKRSEASGSSEQLMAMQEKLTAALERLADANVKGSELIASETRRAHRPSNEVVPGISVFNRRGSTLGHDAPGATDGTDRNPRKAPLRCIMLIPHIVEWESQTREEVELLNLVVDCPGEYVVKRTDNSRIRMEVKVDYKVDNVTPSRMLVNHETAFNNDHHRLMPAASDWLRQILRQTEHRQTAAAIMTDEEEEALIEAGLLSTAA